MHGVTVEACNATSSTAEPALLLLAKGEPQLATHVGRLEALETRSMEGGAGLGATDI